MTQDDCTVERQEFRDRYLDLRGAKGVRTEWGAKGVRTGEQKGSGLFFLGQQRSGGSTETVTHWRAVERFTTRLADAYRNCPG